MTTCFDPEVRASMFVSPMIQPNSPTEGVTVAFIVENGASIEFLQFDRPESEIWPHEAKFKIT